MFFFFFFSSSSPFYFPTSPASYLSMSANRNLYDNFFHFFCTTCVCPPFLTRSIFSNQISPLEEWGRRKVLYASLVCVFLSFLSFFYFNLWGDINNNAEFIYLLFCYLLLFPLTVLRYLASVRGFPSFSRSIPYHT